MPETRESVDGLLGENNDGHAELTEASLREAGAVKVLHRLSCPRRATTPAHSTGAHANPILVATRLLKSGHLLVYRKEDLHSRGVNCLVRPVCRN